MNKSAYIINAGDRGPEKSTRRALSRIGIAAALLCSCMFPACSAPDNRVTTTTSATTTAYATTTTQLVTEAETVGYDIIEVKAKASLPLLEYSVDLALSGAANTLDNPNDIVTPYIEDKFKIRVSDVVQGVESDLGFKERMDKYVASGSLPDVVIAGNENCAYAVATGMYGDLTPQIEKMDNLNKTIDPVFWPRFMNGGKKTQIPITGPDLTKEPYASDPYVAPMSAWGMWIREDILAQCGYTFTTLAEIDRQYLSRGQIAPAAAYATDPPVSTPEDLYELLKKIDGLELTVGGEPLIPWTSSGWSQFHMGCMFDFGHWRVDPETGEADGFLGSPGAREYYRFLHTLYREGLIDAEFMRQSDELTQSKIESGRAATGMYIPSVQDAQAALKQTAGDGAVIRYIEWPKQMEGVGAFDIFENGFWRLIVRDKFPEKDRLTQYFDWFYSEEGQDILTWGPDSAGLWEYRDGVKRFVNPQVEEDCMNGVTGGVGADFWGLYTITSGSYFPYLSRAGICAPYTTINYADYRRSFPPKLDSTVMNRAAVSLGGFDRSGRYAYGDGSEAVSRISSYYWSQFIIEEVDALLEAPDDAAFEDAWDAAYERFLAATGYEEARGIMAGWFRLNYNH